MMLVKHGKMSMSDGFKTMTFYLHDSENRYYTHTIHNYTKYNNYFEF